ncbi:hypothetical protein AB1Y20_013908 [Prymnesium parvum]|uniref:Uncharacterized protein n=1 Tax=Prymnesium parvum TaxID=97485 RepID=A0AB34IFT6_PRYPA
MSAEVPIFQAEQSVNPGEVQTDSQEEPLLQEEGEVTLVDSIPSDDKLSSSTSRPLDEVRRAAADSIEPGCKQWTLADWKTSAEGMVLKGQVVRVHSENYWESAAASMDESELDDSYEEKWVREVAALESLPFVKDGSVNFVASDESANLNKVSL